jgi:hypothetical protein
MLKVLKIKEKHNPFSSLVSELRRVSLTCLVPPSVATLSVLLMSIVDFNIVDTGLGEIRQMQIAELVLGLGRVTGT